MTSKNKNGGDSWGTLYGRPMERLAFCYDRHEEIAKYIRMWHIYYHSMVMRVFCLPLKFSAGFVIPDTKEYNLILNTFHKIYCMYRCLHLKLNELLVFKLFFVQKSLQLKPPFLLFDVIADKVH